MRQLRLPENKMDTAAATAIMRRSFGELEPYLSEILNWMRDYNWPVAQVIAPELVRIGPRLVDHLRPILHGRDPMWQYWILREVIGKSPELAELLVADIAELANSCRPDDEDSAEVLAAASDVLKGINA